MKTSQSSLNRKAYASWDGQEQEEDHEVEDRAQAQKVEEKEKMIIPRPDSRTMVHRNHPKVFQKGKKPLQDLRKRRNAKIAEMLDIGLETENVKRNPCADMLNTQSCKTQMPKK